MPRRSIRFNPARTYGMSELMKAMSLSSVQLTRLRADEVGHFPMPFRDGHQKIYWKGEALAAWLEKRRDVVEPWLRKRRGAE